MSREIKFRCWNAFSNHMHKWSEMVEKNKIHLLSNENRSYVCDQYTGFNDDDSVECYEGDIIRASFGIPSKVVDSVVYFENGMFMTKCVNNKSISPQVCPLNEYVEYLGQFWVIGNIHQNPELLNDK